LIDDRPATTPYDIATGWNRGLRLLVAVTAVAFVSAPHAGADPGSPSYNRGKQAVDDVVRQYGVAGFTDGNVGQDYCVSLLAQLVKSGTIRQLDSQSDFIAGCEDESRVVVASH
jgi:hypothetical protein